MCRFVACVPLYVAAIGGCGVRPPGRIINKVFHAIELAARAHRGQVRKGSGVPYLIHPLNVAKLLIQEGCEEEVVVAGLMHDTVEDTDMKLADI